MQEKEELNEIKEEIIPEQESKLVNKRLVAIEMYNTSKKQNTYYIALIVALFFVTSLNIWWLRIIITVPVISFLGYLFIQGKKKMAYLNDKYYLK